MKRNSPEKQSILDAIEHLLAKYLEMRPLFLIPARPIKVEWKSKPYFGVLLRVFRDLTQNKQDYWKREKSKVIFNKMG
jgi:hypothetical protein